jgi:yeast amino acid transporter
MCVTYLRFYYACKAQGFNRDNLPYKGWFQPYSGWIGLGWMIFIVFTYGYTAFKPWSVDNFFIYYTMLILAPVLYIGWKVIHRTKWVKLSEIDLIWEAPTIDKYESQFHEAPLGFWVEILQIVRFKKNAGSDRRESTIAE